MFQLCLSKVPPWLLISPEEDIIFWDTCPLLDRTALSPWLCFVLPSMSLTPKWLISYNLLTRALFTKTIRNCFQASSPADRTDWHLPVHSPADCQKSFNQPRLWGVTGGGRRGLPHASPGLAYQGGQKAPCTPVLSVLISSMMGQIPPTAVPGSH